MIYVNENDEFTDKGCELMKEYGMETKVTNRENLLRTLRRQGFDWVPIDPGGFCPSQVEAFKRRFGHDDYMGYFNAPHRFVGIPIEKTWSDARSLYPREELPQDTDIDDFGVGHSHQAECFHMTRMHHPLRGEPGIDEVANYPLPRLAQDAAGKMKAKVVELHSKGLAAMAPMACTIWETAWYIRSMEDLMMDMMGDDERAVVHFDRITDLSIERARAAARAGVDILHTGDDIGMQNSPMMSMDLWRKWIKPRFAKVLAAAKEVNPDILIFYHSCGYVLPFIDDLIEVGVDILNPVQPECMSFAEVYGKYGDRLSFWSTIGTQTTMPHGTPEDVKFVVDANLRCCGKNGGIVIGPTHLVEPEVPWANLQALKDACEAFKL